MVRALNWRKLAIRILSLFMAVLLWVYVTNEQNPTNEQLLSVTIQTKGDPPGNLSVGNVPSTVSVRAQGSRGQITGLSESDFKAFIDLSGVTEGEQQLPVTVIPPAGVQVTQVSPRRVTIYADRIVERHIPVVAALKGNTAKGFAALEPLIQPGAVIARGPRRILESINQFVITPNIGGATGAVEQTLPITGIPEPDKVSINPGEVRVTVPVTPLPTKTVAVKSRLSGKPAEGYEIKDVLVNPDGVQVSAPSDLLAGVEWLQTELIDVTGASKDVFVTARVVVPAGVTDVMPDSVEVTVEVGPVNSHPEPAEDEKPPAQNQPPPQ